MKIRKPVPKNSRAHKRLKKQHRTRLGNPKHKPGTMVESLGPGKPSRFKKGNPGKLPGTRNSIPTSVKASIRTILEEVALTEGGTVRSAVMAGLRGGARNADRYIRLVAEYVDGKPADTLNLNNQIKDEELAGAKSRLDRKVAGLVKTILARRAVDASHTKIPK